MTDRPCKDCVAADKAYNEWAASVQWGINGADDPPNYPGEMPPATQRPAPHPGPRCATHHRRKVKAQKAARHEAYVARTYSLGDREYGLLYEAQGGVCAICERATGQTRKLSVDHDHSCCSGGVSCGYCVRGLLCRPCNDMLGHMRDDWRAFARAIRYLTGKPAAERVLGKKRTPERQERMPSAPWERNVGPADRGAL